MKRSLVLIGLGAWVAALAACSDDSFVATNEAVGGEAGAVSTGGDSGTGGVSSGGGNPGGSSSGGISGASGASGSSGASGAAGAGGSSSECTPGQKQDVGTCEKCGTSRRTCDATGHWGAPACEGQGPCAPGAKSTDGCSDPCEEKVCDNACNWGGCGKKSGAACVYKGGTNFQCCGADHWQFCNSATCDWFACQPCQSGSSCFSAC